MPSPWPRGLTLAAGVVLLGCIACATSRVSRVPADLDAHAVVADSRTVVSTEFSRWPDLPLDEALERVRPALVRPMLRDERVVVYVDRQPATFADLHTLLARWVRDVHLLTTAEAQAEYGAFVSQPVLAVRLQHGSGG